MEKEKLIEQLNFSVFAKKILAESGIKTVEDLTLTPIEKVQEVCEKYGRNGKYEFTSIKAIAHYDYKLNFLDEYKELELDPEVANTPVKNLALSTRLKNILTRGASVYTLGDVLTTDYEYLMKARHMGEGCMKELKDYVHSLGYSLKGEEPSLNEKLTILKESGAKLLEETFDDAKVYGTLYRNEIYTLEDLIEFGPRVYELVGMGPLRQKMIREKMAELNLEFNSTIVERDLQANKGEELIQPPTPTMPTYDVIAKAKAENELIRTRINRKEALVSEYNQLLQERQQLLEREKELDQLIESKLTEIKEGVSHGRK